jgi:hypothetical protein
MGREVGDVTFTEENYALFRARLARCLGTLAHVVTHPAFGKGPATIGAELEVSLMGAGGRPSPVNTAVCEAAGDERVTVEVARFGVEINLTPVVLAGHPFTAMAEEAAMLLARITQGSLPRHGTRAVPVGTLPTLEASDVTADALTPHPRFRALEEAWARRRPAPFTVRIADGAHGELSAESVAVQGAACSWQVHLTVPPEHFCRTYNAAQLASGPALAAAVNSPLPLGRRAGQEARIALYEQGFGDRQDPQGEGTRRPRVDFGRTWLHGGPLAAFEEAVRHYDVLLPACSSPAARNHRGKDPYPALDELRLHLSTTWPWNRPVYDPAGNLRIEFRALPSGPTPLDMAANTAFLIGLTTWLAAEGSDVAQRLPFCHAEANFYRAARDGPECFLWWPSRRHGHGHEHQAADLIQKILPHAWEGLRLAGVAADEADTLLHVLERRVATGRTGAWWQQRAREALRDQCAVAGGSGLERAGRLPVLGEMTEHYARLAQAGTPVHTWALPVPCSGRLP